MSYTDQDEQAFWESVETKLKELEAGGNTLIRKVYDLSRESYIDRDSHEYQTLYEDLKMLSVEQPESFYTPLVEAVSAFAGEMTGAIVRYMTEHIAEYPYAQGYYRRPFRTRRHATHLGSLLFKLNRLLIAQANNFSLQEYLTKPDYHVEGLHWFIHVIPDLVAYELDCGDSWAEAALKEIIYGENQTALLKREMIKGILMSHRSELYEMIGELLVAARLQEGLRQSITEEMDAGTLQANLHILRVILDHDLIRYSSIVRALGTWTGMGLEAVNQRVAGQLVEQAYTVLTDEQQRSAWLSSENANQVYLSLWASAVYEEDDLPERIQFLMENGERYQKVVAQYVLSNSQNDTVRFEIARRCLDESDLELLYLILSNYTFDYEYDWQVGGIQDRLLKINRTPALEDKDVRREEFENFKDILTRVPVREKSGQSGVLDFIQFHYQADLVLRKMMYLTAYDMDDAWITDLIRFSGQMSSDLRGDLISYYTDDSKSTVQRSFIFAALSDKSLPNRERALRQVKKLSLNDSERKQVEDMLKLKTGSLRQSAIDILLDQPEEELAISLERLLKAKGELQRLAGLELLTELKHDQNRETQYEALRPLANKISSPSPKEKQLLDKLEQQGGYTAENGFGLYNPQETEEWLLERSDTSNVSFEQIFSLTEERASEFLSGLDDLVHEWRDTEYEIENYIGQKETQLVGVKLCTVSYEKHEDPIEHDNFEMANVLNNYPLTEHWQNYLMNSGLGSRELMQLYYCILIGDLSGTLYEFYYSFSDFVDYDFMRRTKLLENERKRYLERMIPLERIVKIQKLYDGLRYSEQVETLVKAFFWDSERSDTFEVASEALAMVIVSDINELSDKDKPTLFVLAKPWFSILRSRVYNKESFRSFFHTAYQYDLRIKEIENSEYSVMHWNQYFRAYTLGMIGDNELCKELLGRDVRSHMRALTSPQDSLVNRSEKLLALRERIVSRLLDIELVRGDLTTTATPYTMSFERIHGLESFIRILISLGGETFVRGYIYGYGDQITKKESLSHLLKVCYPQEGDDEQKLEQLLKGTGISEKRLLEAAMYAPQWIEIIAKYLGWEGLRSAAWYFHAHINETFSAEKETIVAHYSPITPEDFNNGAFDVKWFEEAYHSLGEERFKLLYDCAKYISAGANHRRSQMFADAVLGQLRLEDMKLSVTDKRNKDHLLAYSLIPLGPIQENDLRERFDFIQLFLKQSRGYGAQRRASEGIVSAIALGNLARSAGYADVTRLTWDMEARRLEKLESLFEPRPLDEDTNVRLRIDEEGNTELEVTSKGKALKSVPARFKKDEYIAELKEVKSDLTEQYRRAKRELERSMEVESCFTVSELAALQNNPVIQPLLRTLVFKAGNHLGYFMKTADDLYRLEEPTGAEHLIADKDEITIAHPLHLYESGLWSEYQRDLFERGIRQPFKQVFRELYLANADEREGRIKSRRYAGHQVQPSKTVALLRSRGWTVSYEEGLQKVSYQKNVIATVYAMADWFSPADSEAPTLETVEFLDRKSYKSIPMDQISPILFSETMRDIDLVVSTAHVGGVDPEASLTTIELRSAIMRESLRLLKLDNVKLEGNYARIDGKLGEYAVNLGSGIAYKQGTGALNIIPVHSQHRGRLFLPFLDEDPRTVEVLSKVVLLAEDNKIKDPQILIQL
ncbi:protein of unknown function [Paenibacillus uliginis N3/975]|uniref:DUF4132 domain-containing protein n=1 Tax=Paenibacillus uliginis N3/975 TaxID=1313296 RepID=A0A1X7HCY1_9BACL|nr:DUF4132 domain-containing protein [Paenibacillus uliginis]SMF83896.1 protein of unknown function [Paenibacillus uliginis N3/975]